MQISDILTEKMVFIDLKADSKRTLLQALANKAAKALGVDSRIIFDALLERESLGSTGFGNGIAIPHARIADIKRVKTFFARLETPVEFEAADNEPVDLVFMMLSPENSGADHLTALSSISRVMKDEVKCAKIRDAKTKEKIYALLVK